MRGPTLLLAGLPKAVNASLHAKLNFVFLNGIAPAAKAMGAPTVTLPNPRLPAWSVLGLVAPRQSRHEIGPSRTRQ